MKTTPGRSASADSPRSVRSERVHAAVLRAAGELLAEGGVPAATIDAISTRAEVSKATIYKYWPNRLCVAIDALAQHMARAVPVPDTGNPREDLTEQVRRVAAFYAAPVGQVYAQLLGTAATDPGAAQLLRERFLAGRRQAIRTLWQRALDQHHARADIDVDIAQDVLFGAVIFRLVSGHALVDPTQAQAIAGAALTGLLNATDAR